MSEQLKVKYNESLKLFKKMHSDFPHERLNCDDILQTKNSWALNEEELEIIDELKNMITSKEYENEFTIYLILRSEKNLILSEPESELESEIENSSSDSSSEAITLKRSHSPEQRDEVSQ
jgi:hypothetical protein